MVKALKKAGQLKKSKRHDLDYDNQVQPTEKYDSEKTYKKIYGYQPGITSIANPGTGQVMPVYIAGSKGNSQANKLLQNYNSPGSPVSINLLTWLTNIKYKDKVDLIRSLDEKSKRDEIKAQLPDISPKQCFRLFYNPTLIG